MLTSAADREPFADSPLSSPEVGVPDAERTVRVQLRSCAEGAKPWVVDVPLTASVGELRALVAAHVAEEATADAAKAASSSWWPWAGKKAAAGSSKVHLFVQDANAECIALPDDASLSTVAGDVAPDAEVPVLYTAESKFGDELLCLACCAGIACCAACCCAAAAANAKNSKPAKPPSQPHNNTNNNYYYQNGQPQQHGGGYNNSGGYNQGYNQGYTNNNGNYQQPPNQPAYYGNPTSGGGYGAPPNAYGVPPTQQQPPYGQSPYGQQPTYYGSPQYGNTGSSPQPL